MSSDDSDNEGFVTYESRADARKRIIREEKVRFSPHSVKTRAYCLTS